MPTQMDAALYQSFKWNWYWVGYIWVVLGTEHMAGLKMEYCTATVDPSMSSLFVLERLWKICMEGKKQGLKVGGSE